MFSLTTILAAIAGVIAVIAGACGFAHNQGKKAGIAQKQPEVDAAKAQTAAVVQQSKDADADVKQSAEETSKEVDAAITEVYSKTDALPTGDAQKELQDKYSRD